MRHYLKYTNCNLLVVLAIVSFGAGGAWLWFPLLFTITVAVLGDTVLPPDLDQPRYRHTWLLNAFLFANLPLLLIAYLVLFWQFADHDLLGLGHFLDQILDGSLLENKALTSGWHRLGGFLGMGLLLGLAATNIAHELVHRTWSPLITEIGRWLLAFTWDGAFAIEHVYGHHRKIGTWEDPATARRGESYFQFLVRSTVGGNLSAWKIERSFLMNKNRPVWSLDNRVLRGWLMSFTIAALSTALLGGVAGLLLHLGLALLGKCYLELVNFIEHYGLVRVPRTPVGFRHSWNSHHSISGWLLFNLTRHSHHHETGHLPFWRLEPRPEAPTLPFGYMTMILIALVPPLHRRVMRPYLETWDQHWATPAENSLARAAGPLASLTPRYSHRI
ncbi:alkane 1-monooxygenase [Oligoflexus tunisiensis]|uniref:alkane 1-monooxygenase n=1 Tax=Oligoflexus tunisiensis TaxID=708132 RepID=UPI000A5D90E3|nr:alkane 1-monooxygenase [Oligoflexus tunisiensis]